MRTSVKFLRHPHFFQLKTIHICLGCFFPPLHGVAALLVEHIVHGTYRQKIQVSDIVLRLRAGNSGIPWKIRRFWRLLPAGFPQGDRPGGGRPLTNSRIFTRGPHSRGDGALYRDSDPGGGPLYYSSCLFVQKIIEMDQLRAPPARIGFKF